MNLVSSLVGLSVMGSAMPMVAQMSIAPYESAKRVQNLGVAESSAVTYAANHEGAATISDAPDGCIVANTNGDAHTITCTEGEGRYVQTVTRAFRLMPQSGSNEPRQFPYVSRQLGGHQCHVHDPWGISWRTDWPTLAQCIPQVLWNENNYLNSNPDDWLWDVNRMKGYGTHPLY